MNFEWSVSDSARTRQKRDLRRKITGAKLRWQGWPELEAWCDRVLRCL